MQNLLLLAELKALGGCPCKACRGSLDRAAQSGVRTGGGGARALRDRALHLLRYCAALAWLGPQATAPAGAGPGRKHHDTMTPFGPNGYPSLAQGQAHLRQPPAALPPQKKKFLTAKTEV